MVSSTRHPERDILGRPSRTHSSLFDPALRSMYKQSTKQEDFATTTNTEQSTEQSSDQDFRRPSPIVIGVICALACVGMCIFLPILFACTLPDDAEIRNTHQHTCTFYDLETTHTHRCCMTGWHRCAGCSLPAFMNGKCAAVQGKELARNISLGNTQTPCCDGRCCARSHTECDTCQRESCTSDSKGHRSCNTEYYECNCRKVCDEYDESQGSVACGTCHEYRVGFFFVLDGVRHDRRHHLSCGLTKGGTDDVECQRAVAMDNADNVTKTCFVNHDTMKVSWEAPSWNDGCWVGISIGSLLLLPLVSCGPIYLIYLSTQWFRTQHAAWVERRERERLDLIARGLYEEALHALQEQKSAVEARIADGRLLRVVLIPEDGDAGFEVVVNDKWEVAEVLEALPLVEGDTWLRMGEVRMSSVQATLRDFAVEDGALLHCSSVDHARLSVMWTGAPEDRVVELRELTMPAKPSLEEIRKRVEKQQGSKMIHTGGKGACEGNVVSPRSLDLELGAVQALAVL